MPASGGIEAFREKLHARMAALCRGGGGAEPRDRDELLEERRHSMQLCANDGGKRLSRR
jgi:hypothetical protein